MSIILENSKFRLILNENAVAESLILKANGEELISKGNELPFISLTEERPYNNEIKLAHPNKRTTFQANRIRMENGKLIIGFELITFEAVVDVKIADRYMAFTLEDFNIKYEDFGGLCMTPPPVYEFRLVQLPVKPREHFGEWLNVMWDEKAAVNVLACDPYPRIDSEKRKDHRVLYGETLRDMKLKGSTVGLIVADKDELLDAINDIEYDYDLPKGVESRRSGKINRTYFQNSQIFPENVDEWIKYIKKGGFKNVCIYYPAITKDHPGYSYSRCGEYDVREDKYPGGIDDLRAMVKKMKDAGLTVGYHFLHTHIGLFTSYVSPVADYRLNTTKKFRLAKPLSETDTEIYVEENPTGSVMHEKCRTLMFMGELIKYEGYTTERPYKFYGCERGAWNTNVRTHELGEWGGILDISEFCAGSCYVDQRTSLQDEIAEKIAKIWDCGFEFVYYDGSEGTEPPFEINVPLAQYRVYKKLNPAPIYCEGAAKAHFSWHMVSGGNAFDRWGPDVFKAMIVEHPFREAPQMANDFTRLNFGWWGIGKETHADLLEYGSSRGAAWDCPGAVAVSMETLQNHPRIDDILEVTRRWEDVRENGFLTEEKKEMLKDASTEHTLLINEAGEYELVPYYQVKEVTEANENVYAFTFERGGKAYAVIWNNVGDSKLSLKLDGEFTYKDELAGADVAVEKTCCKTVLPLAGKRYLCTDMSVDALRTAIANAKTV